MTGDDHQDFRLVELTRRVANIVRLGTVEEVDGGSARVRVRYGETALSRWLPWVTARAGEDRSWWAPEVGEQVLILAPSGDLAKGIVVAGVYRSEHPAPESDPDKHAIHYSDGAVIEYDRSAHRLKADLPEGGGAKVTADGGVTITGDVMISGDLTVSGDADVTGSIDAGSDVSDDTGTMADMRTKYNQHVHTPTAGSPPTPQMD